MCVRPSVGLIFNAPQVSSGRQHSSLTASALLTRSVYRKRGSAAERSSPLSYQLEFLVSVISSGHDLKTLT